MTVAICAFIITFVRSAETSAMTAMTVPLYWYILMLLLGRACECATSVVSNQHPPS